MDEYKKHQRWAVPKDNGSYILVDGNGNLIKENISLEKYDNKLLEKHKHEDGSILLSLVEMEKEK